MGMAAMPRRAFPARGVAPIYRDDASATSVEELRFEMQTTSQNRNDFHKAIDGVVGTRTREATRQICRPYEYQLIGAFTKRPN